MRSRQVRLAGLAVAAMAVGATSPADPVLAETHVPVPLSSCVQTDNGDPVITALEVSPRRVDLTSGPRHVQVRVRLHDTGGPGPATGMTSVKVLFRTANLGVTQSWPMVRERGGIWSVTAKLRPSTTAPGRLVPNFTMDDQLRTTVWDASDLQSAGLAGEIRVRNKAEPDTSRPRMAAFRISPPPVDTQAVEQTVMFRARIVDHVAGVRRITVHSSSDSGPVPRVRLSLVRGTRRDGAWVGGVTSVWPGNATWHLYVKIVDRAGNRRIYGRTALRSAGFPHVIRVVGRSDTEAPAVGFLSIEPNSVDTTVDDQKVLVDVSASDSTSYVQHVSLRLLGPESNQVHNYWTGFAHVGGGTWETLLWMPTCYAMSGVYDLLVRAVDAAGNRTDITVPAALQVTAAADTSISRPGVATPSPPGRVQVSFPEDVTGLSTRSGLVTTHSDGTGPAEPGTWTCSGADGSGVDCEQGWLRSATFVPAEALSPGAAYGLVLNPEHVLDVRDRAGNPYRRDTTLIETSP